MAGGKQDTSDCLVLADDIGSSGGGQDGVLSDDELLDAVSRSDSENDLHGLRGEITAITTDDESGAFCIDRVEDGLDEVLCVVLQNDVQRRECTPAIMACLLLEDLDPVLMLLVIAPINTGRITSCEDPMYQASAHRTAWY